jgi:parallel beta-helix repeat protein
MKKELVLVGALLWLIGGLPTAGGEGAIPIWEPVTITEPGRYVLTRNITDSDTRTIDVQSPDVHIDLNGFTAENTGGGWAVFCWGGDRMQVRNGTLKGGGVFIYWAEDVLVSDVTISDPNDDGIYMEDSSGVVTDNRIIDAGAHGIYIAAFEYAFVEASVVGNVIQDPTEKGIYLWHCWRSVIAENQVHGGTRGIHYYSSSGGEIYRNTVNFSEFGIYINGTNGAQVYRNTVRKCTDTGMYLDYAEYNHLEANVLTGNGTGLYFGVNADDNLYRGNTSRGSTTADFTDLGVGNTSHRDNYMPGAM